MNKQTNISNFFLNQDYDKLISFYEQQIENDNDNYVNYIYLGLAYLLSGKEVEAQTAWFYILTQNNKDYHRELIKILDEEATNQEVNKNYHLALLIRNNVREIDNQDVNNILGIINLELTIKTIYDYEQIEGYNLIFLLENTLQDSLNDDLLWDIISKLLLLFQDKALPLAIIGLQCSSNLDISINSLSFISKKFFHTNNFSLAIKLLELCLEKKPDDLYLIKNLFWFYYRNNVSDKAHIKKTIEIAKKLDSLADNIGLKVYVNYLILELLLGIGLWKEFILTKEKHELLLKESIKQQQSPKFIIDAVVNVNLPWIANEDNPRKIRVLQNEIGKLFQNHTINNYGDLKRESSQVLPSSHLVLNEIRKDENHKNKLRIGYISAAFLKSPVGWLSRCLFKYSNQDNFDLYLYCISNIKEILTDDFFQNSNCNVKYLKPDQVQEITETIYNDRLDILVDLDCLTGHITSQIMALKPTPIQVSYLGLDATGIPNIDYFIADSYVLPEDAQDYYSEKIWRLPHCYIGVDGYPVGIPTISKSDLGIDEDAITYLTIQTGWKRNQDWLRKQMQILKQVNNSYLLIQCNPNHETIEKLAKEENINPERIKFLPFFPHDNYRANLRIADILLDNYPFNGATTTIDALWMEIPIITRVGQQYHARQGYTLLKNIGIDEGIAWNDEEYINWGVKLGNDENLRQEIAWKVKQSKKISPLWNGRQFAREMENAYQQMWDIYYQQNKRK